MTRLLELVDGGDHDHGHVLQSGIGLEPLEHVRMPSSSGMTMSSRTTSGGPSGTRSSASRPFAAVST